MIYVEHRNPEVRYEVRRSSRRRRCENGPGAGRKCQGAEPCTGWIEEGERYVRMSLVPGSEIGNTSWWTLYRHAAPYEGDAP